MTHSTKKGKPMKPKRVKRVAEKLFAPTKAELVIGKGKRRVVIPILISIDIKRFAETAMRFK